MIGKIEQRNVGTTQQELGCGHSTGVSCNDTSKTTLFVHQTQQKQARCKKLVFFIPSLYQPVPNFFFFGDSLVKSNSFLLFIFVTDGVGATACLGVLRTCKDLMSA
jgi:hypothetical protein